MTFRIIIIKENAVDAVKHTFSKFSAIVALTMAHLQFQKSEDFGAANFVMDFQMDIIDLHNPNILIKKGPNLDLLDKHDKNDIASTIMELWSIADNSNNSCLKPNSIKKYLCCGCCLYILILLAMVGILESNFPFFDMPDRIRRIIAIALGSLSITILIIILFGLLFLMQQRYILHIT